MLIIQILFLSSDHIRLIYPPSFQCRLEALANFSIFVKFHLNDCSVVLLLNELIRLLENAHSRHLFDRLRLG